MNCLYFILIIFFTQVAQAQLTSFRYEGKLAGPLIVGGTQPSQIFTVSLRRPDLCGGNLGLTTWTSPSTTLEDGAFSISPSFLATQLGQAMNPWNDFTAGCSTPYYGRQLVIGWNGETFIVDLEDAPRSTFSAFAYNALAIGGVNVQANLTCTSNQVLKFNSVSTRFECMTLAPTDIPTLTATHIPNLAGDVSGNIATTTVQKIRGINVSATAPTTNQVLKYNGTDWAPAADDAGTSSDATYAAKGIIQVDSSAAISGLNLTTGVLSLPNVITAGGPTGGATTVPVITYDQKGRLTAVTSAPVNDTAKLPLAGGTMTGSLNMGTQNITNATNISTTNISATSGSLRNLILNDNDSNTVTIRTPTDISSNYNLVLPLNDGNAGEVLSTDGSGNLNWVSTGASNAFIDGGNSVGADSSLGTNTNFQLDLKTNNIPRIKITNDGRVHIGNLTPSPMKFDIDGGLNMRSLVSAPPVSPSFQGRIYFDDTTGKFRVSEDGGAYVDMIPSAGTYVLQSDYNNDIDNAMACTGLQTPYWSSGTDEWLCQNIDVVNLGGLFKEGGNSIASDITLGNNLNFALNFETSGSTRMTIDSLGRIGFGTSAPSAPLHSSHFTTSTGNLSGNLFSLNASPTANHTGLYSLSENNLFLNGTGNINMAYTGNFQSFTNTSSAIGEMTTLKIFNHKSSTSSGTTSFSKGIGLTAQNDGGLVSYGRGIASELRTGSSGSYNEAFGIVSEVATTGSGSIANGKAFVGVVNNAGTSTMTEAVGLEIGVTGSNIANSIGIRIGNISGTSKYAIHQTDATARNYFEGKVGIGTSSPAADLHVDGTMRIGSTGSNLSKVIICSNVLFDNTTAITNSSSAVVSSTVNSCLGVESGMVVHCSLDSENYTNGVIYTFMTTNSTDMANQSLRIKVTNMTGATIALNTLDAIFSCTGTK